MPRNAPVITLDLGTVLLNSKYAYLLYMHHGYLSTLPILEYQVWEVEHARLYPACILPFFTKRLTLSTPSVHTERCFTVMLSNNHSDQEMARYWIVKVLRDYAFLRLTYETIRFHKATLSCIVEHLHGFLPELWFFAGVLYISLREEQRSYDERGYRVRSADLFACLWA
jgi:hypothetical protein